MQQERQPSTRARRLDANIQAESIAKRPEPKRAQLEELNVALAIDWLVIDWFGLVLFVLVGCAYLRLIRGWLAVGWRLVDGWLAVGWWLVWRLGDGLAVCWSLCGWLAVGWWLAVG